MELEEDLSPNREISALQPASPAATMASTQKRADRLDRDSVRERMI